MADRTSLDTLNSLPARACIAMLGDVFEHAAWVAEGASQGRPYPTVTALHEAMMLELRSAPAAQVQRFIGGHPELGGRVKRLDLTNDSQSEQGGLGLDRLSGEEFERFSRLNAAYREKFGFPSFACAATHAIPSCGNSNGVSRTASVTNARPRCTRSA
jgi:2-oxo-4-hydroxy-4-carboxy-5-ureidoimidazoline decarboxylase